MKSKKTLLGLVFLILSFLEVNSQTKIYWYSTNKDTTGIFEPNIFTENQKNISEFPKLLLNGKVTWIHLKKGKYKISLNSSYKNDSLKKCPIFLLFTDKEYKGNYNEYLKYVYKNRKKSILTKINKPISYKLTISKDNYYFINLIYKSIYNLNLEGSLEIEFIEN